MKDRSDKQQKLPKSSIILGIAQCIPLKYNRRLGGTFNSIFLVEEQAKLVFFDSENGGETFFRNVG
jgi:hypothetical protein